MKTLLLLFSILLCVSACDENKKQGQFPCENGESTVMAEPVRKDTIIDADYTFDEAVMGTKAPQSIISQLELFDVFYHSTDGQIHKGQILSNKKIAEEIRALFLFMLNEEFVVDKAIPIVRYNWNDSLSMADNNSYSFCYRNIAYSRHASGMAIDINPRFNPLRWKKVNRPSRPAGAVSDTTVNGTLHPAHPVVKEFRKKGFRWGHTFSQYYDDHHFEK
ncbi:MAG: M15 family metallopeptidase [Bacteroidales bacterium]|jgi:hypothetical protein|nr:M15 family metallopeptidase [Bacteroidales bacterium]